MVHINLGSLDASGCYDDEFESDTEEAGALAATAVAAASVK